jgi:4-hydroxybenzoate polyprenyltransferase
MICYYCLHILIFWGHCALGTTHPDESMWLFVALFIFANIWIFAMAFFGHFQNKKDDIQYWIAFEAKETKIEG